MLCDDDDSTDNDEVGLKAFLKDMWRRRRVGRCASRRVVAGRARRAGTSIVGAGEHHGQPCRGPYCRERVVSWVIFSPDRWR
jgi:hypothetical protein